MTQEIIISSAFFLLLYVGGITCVIVSAKKSKRKLKARDEEFFGKLLKESAEIELENRILVNIYRSIYVYGDATRFEWGGLEATLLLKGVIEPPAKVEYLTNEYKKDRTEKVLKILIDKGIWQSE